MRRPEGGYVDPKSGGPEDSPLLGAWLDTSQSSSRIVGYSIPSCSRYVSYRSGS